MTATARWALLALGLALFVGAVVVVRVWPAEDRDVDAAMLAARVQEASGASWSGYVETQGRLVLPDADRFSSVGDLLGERTRLRAWWSSPDAWRVDELRPGGEVGLRHEGRRTTEWSYESAADDREVDRAVDPDVRLPRTVDLLPPELARHVLDGVEPDEVTRIGARRIAGRDALGLEVTPSLDQASVSRVELWADAETGVALAVELYGAGGSAGDAPVLATTFREFSPAAPDPSVVTPELPAGVDVVDTEVLDIVDAVARFAEERPPASLAGLSRTDDSSGAVGVYGRGVTRMLALPLWSRAADPLREQLALTPGALVSPGRTLAALGPLGVLLTDDGDGDGWLVTGTVTPETLERAGRRLAPEPVTSSTAHDDDRSAGDVVVVTGTGSRPAVATLRQAQDTASSLGRGLARPPRVETALVPRPASGSDR